MDELELFEGRKETFAVKIENYEVPMDMLLDLIARAEISIRDVFVSDVTDQYLAYVKTLDRVDIEKASYFVSYATRILDIKVRSLLPKTEEETLQLEEEKESFIYELEMRQIFLDAMSGLRERETYNVFRNDPEFTKDDYRRVIDQEEFNLGALADAFSRLMYKFALKEDKPSGVKVIRKDRFTVVDKTKELIILLKEKQRVMFTSLFEVEADKPPYTIGEYVNTFLAVLELCKRQFITVEQEEEFGEIALDLREGAESITYESIVGNMDANEYEYKESN